MEQAERNKVKHMQREAVHFEFYNKLMKMKNDKLDNKNEHMQIKHQHEKELNQIKNQHCKTLLLMGNIRENDQDVL